MRHYHYFFMLIFACLFSLSPVFADDNDDDSGVEKRQIYRIYEDIDLIPTVKINYGNHSIIAKSTYPKLVSETDHEDVEIFNEMVADILKEEFQDFKKQVVTLKSTQQNVADAQGKNELTIDFASSIVNTTDKPIVSIRFSIQGYIAGMAHPFHRHRVLNFDLDNGQKLELVDLFTPDSDYLNVLANYSRDALGKKLTDKSMLKEGTAPTAENYKNWNINPNGLLITFDEYQVAPYVFGTQSVLIPYAELKSIISTKSPVGACLKHKSKCLRNNLLTGGFMDEA